MSQELNVVLVQMTSTNDVEFNSNQAINLLKQIKNPDQVDLISFPENCLYLRVEDGETVSSFELNNKIFVPFSEYAKGHKVFLHLGSVPLNKGGKIFNSTVIIDDNGKVSAEYSKIHLFDVHVDGHKPVRESQTFTHGEHPNIIKIKDWAIGLSICYDIRFPELFLYYSRHHVDIIMLPAAFLVPTGKAHWEILLRARAIESQAYVIAAAQWGMHKGKLGGSRETFGHSMVIDPWGTKVVEASDGIGIIEAKLEKALVQKVRKQIPMKTHRRL